MTKESIIASAKKPWVQITLAIIIFLGGSFSSNLIDYFKTGRDQQYGSYQNLLERLDREVLEIKQDNKILLQQNLELKRQIADLRQKLLLNESNSNDFPFPTWFKSSDGIMLELNKEYEAIFLTPRGYTSINYIGANDRAVWSEEISKTFQKNDDKVIKEGKINTFQVKIPNGSGREETWLIIKYPRYIGRILIGVAGIAIPKNTEEYLTDK